MGVEDIGAQTTQHLYEKAKITGLSRLGEGNGMGLQTRQLSLLAQSAVFWGNDDDLVPLISHPERFGQDANALAAPGHRGFCMYNI